MLVEFSNILFDILGRDIRGDFTFAEQDVTELQAEKIATWVGRNSGYKPGTETILRATPNAIDSRFVVMAEPYNEFWFRWWRKITEHSPADIPHPHTGSSEFCDVCNRSIIGHEEGTADEIAKYEAQLRRRARIDWYAMPPK